MKLNDYELLRIAMEDGDDDYDDYEEEVIERDEEYDDEDEDEEEYDDYDDEEYDDEEYDDYDDEEYDDGYDEDYYDDRLNKVLDELAELKRGMSAPAVVQQQQPQQVPPVQPYVLPVTHSTNNEVVMYNEISRLRDELSKTQNEQTLHVELTRLKDEMEKDKRANESALKSEIQRLTEKIDKMEKEADSKPALNSASNGPSYAALPEGSVSSSDFNKLVDINDAILRNSRETDNRVLSDLNAVKTKLDSITGDDLAKSLASIKKAVKTIDERTAELDKLSEQLESLKKVIGENGGSTELTDGILAKLGNISVNSSVSVDTTEITRLIYELKAIIGSADKSETESIQKALIAYANYSAFKNEISSASFTDKLSAIEEFISANTDGVPSDVAESFTATCATVLSEPISRESFDAFMNFASKEGITVPVPTREAANGYIANVKNLATADLTSVIDVLPDVEKQVNELQKHANVDKNAAIVSSIISHNADLMVETDAEKSKAIENAMKSDIASLCSVKISDVITYAPKLKVAEVVPADVDAITLFDVVSALGANQTATDAVDDNVAINQAEFDDLRDKNEKIIAILDELATVSNQAEFDDLRDKGEKISAVLDEIVAKLNDNDVFISQIADLRTDVIALSQLTNTVDTEKLIEDINVQLDKLYEDLLASQSEVTNSISAKLDEVSAKLVDVDVTGIATSISEVKEQVQAIENDIATNAILSQDNQNAIIASIDDIRDMLAPSSEDAEGIIDKLDALYDRLEEFATRYEERSENALNEIADIKEQIHLKEIENEIEATNATEEEKQALLTEITTLRERTETLEQDYNEQAELQSAQLGVIADQITEIKTALSENTAVADIDKLKEDIAFIRSQIEDNITEEGEGGEFADSATESDVSVILDDLNAIKEKLNSLDEYDAVAEIMSLREDVKSSRITDVNEVTAELESLKGDLLELKAEISEIKILKTEYNDEDVLNNTGVQAPSNDEVNLLLNEIVSLRDELQAYKDDINEFITKESSEPAETIIASGDDENFAAVLDELATIRADISAYKSESAENHEAEIEQLKDNVAEIKDMIARRTTLNETVNESPEQQAASNELNVVLDEIIDLKNEVNYQVTDLKNEVELLRTLSDDYNALEEIKNQLNEMQNKQAEAVANETDDLDGFDVVLDEIRALREEVVTIKASEEKIVDESEVEANNAVLDELRALREEIATIKASEEKIVDESEVEANNAVLDELRALREEIATIKASEEKFVDESEIEANNAILDELRELKESLAELRVVATATPSQESYEQQNVELLDEIRSLRDEIEVLKATAAAPVADEAVMAEVIALRDDMEYLRENISKTVTQDIITAVDDMRADVRGLRDEPDLTVVNEVMALRDEFQAFKDEMYKTRTNNESATDNSEVVSQVQQLRDQMFAISMANVNDGTTNDVTYESYNNIILDEISSLREELSLLKGGETNKELAEDILEVKQKLATMAVEEKENITAQFDLLRAEIDDLKVAKNNQVTGEILENINTLKEELKNQREADATTINFMAEMAHLLERQNQYITQSSNSQLVGEIESLKAEIATSLSTQPSIVDEIAKLKEELSQNSGEAVVIDNQAILDELAKIKEELSAKDSQEDELILREISRLKDEISSIIENEKNDAVVTDKKEEPSAQKATASKAVSAKATSTKSVKTKSATSKSTAKKSTAKKSTAKKSTAKATTETAEKEAEVDEVVISVEDDTLSADALISKIEATSIAIPRSITGDALALDPNEIPDQRTEDAMDIASKLARQVANKLIMEQLVQQLGDGGVSEAKVNEIVKDILPSEFSTVQIDEQTDQVRRLANSLVLDKLRARLTNKKTDE